MTLLKPALHPELLKVTERIRQRSKHCRSDYLKKMTAAQSNTPQRSQLSCGNLAHGFAACNSSDKQALSDGSAANVAIVSAYNDMLSAHQPYAQYPEKIKQAVRSVGATAQVAGGVPAMCDGVTQGREGMELSLFSRDLIAMTSAVALSHNMFDAAVFLGICDKIVPGLLIGALHFGHLPCLFIPAGPMPSGLGNKEKIRIRQLYSEGKVDRQALLKAESESYHSPGTCTFYGTANTNQLLMEIMGLQLPGASFVNPNTVLREALTIEAAQQVTRLTALGDDYRPIAQVIDERSIVNAMVGLLASGGSTNLTIHLIAIARAAGIIIDWQDLDTLSKVVPLLTRIYPNGPADINHFQAAGGMPVLIAELLNADLLHGDALTVAAGKTLSSYVQEPFIDHEQLRWREPPPHSLDKAVISSANKPFAPTGGLNCLTGNLGRGIVKTSAVDSQHQQITGPAKIFNHQDDLLHAFNANQLNQDFIAVVRYQGPQANGMPELHKLMPPLGVLQDKGFKVALVTDGRLSGASGKVPAAIHIHPEAANGGALSLIKDDDIVTLDCQTGQLNVQIDEREWQSRIALAPDNSAQQSGVGRELFQAFRHNSSSAESGASFFSIDKNHY